MSELGKKCLSWEVSVMYGSGSWSMGVEVGHCWVVGNHVSIHVNGLMLPVAQDSRLPLLLCI